jgi:hypothetical protein
MRLTQFLIKKLLLREFLLAQSEVNELLNFEYSREMALITLRSKIIRIQKTVFSTIQYCSFSIPRTRQYSN